MRFSYLLSLALIPAVLAGFPDNLPQRRSRFLPRQETTSDPCCKSCATIAAVEAECPADADIFCGCDQWVATAQECDACIFNVGFNTTFASDPGPALELFWAWCQCQESCHTSADAIFGELCDYGANGTCTTIVLANDGPGCECCLKKVDPWFAGFFGIWVEQAKAYLTTGSVSFPGTHTCS